MERMTNSTRARVGRLNNDFTDRNTTLMTWDLLHLARLLKDLSHAATFTD